MIAISFKTEVSKSKPVDELSLKSETKDFKKHCSDTADAS
jgi:hypothetical protein